MNILVLGGTYFLGKHFVKQIYMEHQVVLFNRGNRPMGISQIEEITGDRHNQDAFSQLQKRHFDVVVDFCAYEKGDIATVFSHLQSGVKQYIYISTCDVYKHGTGTVLDENAEFETRVIGGDAGAYIAGKVALEEELVQCADQSGTAYTSIRPAIIYGPDNYAPRETMYFHWIKEAGQILHPVDATGEFQMVYVMDVVKAIRKAMGNRKAYNQAYNLTPTPMITYEAFAQALAESVQKSFEKVPVPLQMVISNQIPLPFPLTKEESNWYKGDRVLELIGNYTPLTVGLAETAKLFGLSIL